MRHINLETWPRREHFKVFSAWDYPHFSLCANVDLTAFYPVVKQRGISGYTAKLWVTFRQLKAGWPAKPGRSGRCTTRSTQPAWPEHCPVATLYLDAASDDGRRC
jgi:hypothetical protein